MKAKTNEMGRSAAASTRGRCMRVAVAVAAAGLASSGVASSGLAARGTAVAAGLPHGHEAGLAAQRHAAARKGADAHAAHTLKASDRASLRYRSAKGSTLYETGRASGSLPGEMRVHMQVSAVFTGTFTIYANGGTITGRGRAIPHGEGTIESFKGELTVTSGSRRYRHASGHAQLYGTFNRRTYALTIQTAGTLRY